MVNESNKTCKFFFCVMCVWFIQPIQINNKLISIERNKGLYQIRYAAVNPFLAPVCAITKLYIPLFPS